MKLDIKLHIEWADTLRGAGAIWVTLFHLSAGAEPDGSLYARLVENGPLGVLMFFVVSGFSVYLSFVRAAGPRDFAAKRFWRIYPPYILSFGLCVVVALARKIELGSNDFIGVPKTIGDVLAVLTLTTVPASNVPTINLVFWTLSYEAAFYVILTICAVHRALSWPIIIAVTLASLLSGHSPKLGAYYTTPSPLFFLNQWSFFALGICIAEFYRGGRLKGAGLFTLCLADFVINRNVPEVAIALATGATLTLSMTRSFQFLNAEKFLSAVGRWSYSLYLIHVPVGVFLLLRLAGSLRAHGLAARMLLDMLILICLILISRFLWANVEMTFARIGKRQAGQAVVTDQKY